MSLLARISLFIGALCLFFLTVGSQSSAVSKAVSFQSEQLWRDTTIITVPGVLSTPKGKGPFPAIVILPNCGGPKTFEFSKFWPRYLNKIGYATLNVDYFTPRKLKKCNKKFIKKKKEMIQDAYGALKFLASLPEIDKDRIGVLGSSLGGAIINRFVGGSKTTSQGLTFAAAVSLYPSSCKTVKPRPRMIPLMIIIADQEIGINSCRAMISEPGLKLTILPNTYHAFDQPSAKPRKKGGLRKDIVGNKLLYSKSATEKAQALVKDFLLAKLSESSAPTEASAPAKVEQTDAPRLGKVGGKDPHKAVSKRDADGDGKVSADEWDKSSNFFSKIDGDGDGFLTAQEFYDHWQSRQ